MPTSYNTPANDPENKWVVDESIPSLHAKDDIGYYSGALRFFPTHREAYDHFERLAKDKIQSIDVLKRCIEHDLKRHRRPSGWVLQALAKIKPGIYGNEKAVSKAASIALVDFWKHLPGNYYFSDFIDMLNERGWVRQHSGGRVEFPVVGEEAELTFTGKEVEP